jgi:ParB-like chromosome segregation protein Spo0J
VTNPKQIAVSHVPAGELQPNPWNSNVVGPEMEQRLRESVSKFGLYKPIIVRELADGSLQILGGQHRWQVAASMGFDTVPVVNLGVMSDRKAKAIGLADNGRYGEDDSLRLAAILKDVGEEFEIEGFLPFTEKDLAGIFASEDIDLDTLGLAPDATAEHQSLDDAVNARPTITHELMRFKVPVADREMVEQFVQQIVKTRGLSSEEDSLVQVGMALVEIVRAAREVM